MSSEPASSTETTTPAVAAVASETAYQPVERAQGDALANGSGSEPAGPASTVGENVPISTPDAASINTATPASTGALAGENPAGNIEGPSEVVGGPAEGEEASTAEQRISNLPARAEDAAVRIKESHDQKRLKISTDGDQALRSPPATVPATVNVDNSNVLESVSHLPERLLGSEVYEPGKLLLREYDDYWNSILEVRLARRYVSQNHYLVQRRAVWGTSIYTDDSDLVAALYHEGYFDTGSKLDSSSDLLVSLRVLPPLRKYLGCTRHGINSRTWLSPHDGTSYAIVDVTDIAQGSAEFPLNGRRQRAKAWSEAYALARPASQRSTPHPAEV